jgi:hypothetical protein
MFLLISIEGYVFSGKVFSGSKVEATAWQLART